MADRTDRELLELFERHRNELRLHCYRMLGSSHDVDDVLQEAAVRAWRAKDSLAEDSNVRAWLYRIATNVCLDEIARRRSRALPFELGPAATDPTAAIAPPDPEALLEPCPGLWFDAVTTDPGAPYELRESVALAFVAALQQLTATQRATLLLRDVVGFSAEETARALEVSVEAANSALFRARGAVEAKLAGRESGPLPPLSTAHEGLLARYLAAWNELDVGAFVALLHEDVRTTMPPSPTWIAGRAQNTAFYAPMFAGRRPGSFIAVPVRANAFAAFAFYRADTEGQPHRFRAIHLIDVKDGAVVAIDHFMLPDLARTFGLPVALGHAEVAAALHDPSCLEILTRTADPAGP